jgi:O-antigen/teichoic acid export membrane protein
LLNHVARLIKNSFGFSLGTLLPMGMGIFLIPLYTRFFSTSDYGILSLVLVVESILALFFSLSLQGAVMRFFVDYEGEERRSYLGSVGIFLIIYSFSLALILTLFGKPLFGLIFKSGAVKFNPFLLLKIWTIFCATGAVIPMALFRIRERAFTYSLIQVSSFLLSVGFIIYFVAYLKKGILGVIEGGFYAALIMFVVYSFILFRSININLSLKKIKRSLKFSMPIIPHSISGFILRFFDRFMLERFLTLSDVGLYALGYKFGIIMKIIINSFNSAWLPFFYKTAAETANAKQIFARLITFWAGAVVLVALIISLFSREILMLIATPQFYNAYKVAPVLVVAYLFRGFYLFPINGLFFAKKTKFVPVVTGIAALVDIILLPLFIARFGMMGAAFATATAFFVSFLAAYYFCQKYYPMQYEYYNLIRILFLGILVYSMTSLIAQGPLIFNIFVKLIGLIFYPAGLFMMRIIEVSHVKKMINLRKVSVA